MMLKRSYREFSYDVPLDKPIKTDAFMAEGDDAPWQLICLPGTPCRKSMFTRLMRIAPGDLDIIVISRLGFGKGHNQTVLDFHEQVKVVEPFLGKKRTIVMGVSYGGALALTTALDYGDQIEGVITLAALVTEPFDYARMMADLGQYKWLNRMAPQYLRHTSAEIRGRRPQIEALLDQAGQLSVPAEILHGNLDNLVSRKDAQKLATAIGDNAFYEEVTGGTHYMELQMPQRVLTAVRRLITRIESLD